MRTCLALLAGFIIFAVNSPPAFGGTIYISVPAKSPRNEWLLGLIDGHIGFLGKWQGTADESALAVIPSDNGRMREAFSFHWSGNTLQVEVSPEEQAASKIQAEKNQWYLTAKYTDNGGEVVLTKDETKYSHWKFIEARPHKDEIDYYYVKNTNDLGKEAWLGIESSGTRYLGHREVRKLKLSFGEKQVFGVERRDAHSGSK